MRWTLFLLVFFIQTHNATRQYHNATQKRGIVNKFATKGFGRVLTWNVKKLGACLRQDNVSPLKEAVCVVLQSAFVIVLQEASNLDFSCLPCNAVLRDEYEWPDYGNIDDFKILVRTTNSRSFTLKKTGSCEMLDSQPPPPPLGNPTGTTSGTNKRNLHFHDPFARSIDSPAVKRAINTINRFQAHDSGSIYRGQRRSDDSQVDNDAIALHGLNTTGKLRFIDFVHEVFSSNNTTSRESDLKNRQFQGESFDMEGLKSRFLRDKDRLYESTINDKERRAKFKLIDSQLSQVEQEIEDMEATNERRDKSSQSRFANNLRSENEENDKENTRRKYEEVASSKAKENEHFQKLPNDEKKEEPNNIESKKKMHELKMDGEPIKTKEGVNENRDESKMEEARQKQTFQDIMNSDETEVTRQRAFSSGNEKIFHQYNHGYEGLDERAKERNDHDDIITVTSPEHDALRHRKITGTESEEDQQIVLGRNIIDTDRFKMPGVVKGGAVKGAENIPLKLKQRRAKRSLGKKNKSKNKKKKRKNNAQASKRQTAEATPTPNLPPVQPQSPQPTPASHVVQVAPEEKDNEEKDNGLNKPDKHPSESPLRPPQHETGEGRIVDDKTFFTPGYLTQANQAARTKLNYVIFTIKSDLNMGDPFILANVKLPKAKSSQRACMQKIAGDISQINNLSEEKYKKIIAGDFHMDRLSGSDEKGEMYKILTNLQIDGENYHSPLTYSEKDPITTVYGRRFDNIITSLPMKGNLKAIGPDFPLEPEAVVMPFILQRLYNNYMTSLYTSDNDESDNIYDCIKAFQMRGKQELQNNVCKDTWTPSSYISDHLPLELRVSMKVQGRNSPVEMRLASWNIQGDSFKERLMDPDVKRGFMQRIKKYHVAVFHEFPPHDKIIDEQELGGGEILRLKQGDLNTEFGIYISEAYKSGDTDMFVLRKKFKGEQVGDVLINPTKEESDKMVTTVGLFAPRMVIDSYKIQPCFYTVRTSDKQRSSGIDFERIISAIEKDVVTRKCDFKLLMASLSLEDDFDIDKVVYDKFKFINLKCQITDGEMKYKYNVPRSRDLADFIISLGKDPEIEFSECKIGLPGDEGKRGIDKLSDFEELTTHYPYSVVVKRTD